MRVHIDVDEELLHQVDRLAGPRGRSRFIRSALERAVEQELRWGLIEQAASAIPASGHEWDDDPAGWVRQQRRGDPRRGG